MKAVFTHTHAQTSMWHRKVCSVLFKVEVSQSVSVWLHGYHVLCCFVLLCDGGWRSSCMVLLSVGWPVRPCCSSPCHADLTWPLSDLRSQWDRAGWDWRWANLLPLLTPSNHIRLVHEAIPPLQHFLLPPLITLQKKKKKKKVLRMKTHTGVKKHPPAWLFLPLILALLCTF